MADSMLSPGSTGTISKRCRPTQGASSFAETANAIDVTTGSPLLSSSRPHIPRAVTIDDVYKQWAEGGEGLVSRLKDWTPKQIRSCAQPALYTQRRQIGQEIERLGGNLAAFKMIHGYSLAIALESIRKANPAPGKRRGRPRKNRDSTVDSGGSTSGNNSVPPLQQRARAATPAKHPTLAQQAEQEQPHNHPPPSLTQEVINLTGKGDDNGSFMPSGNLAVDDDSDSVLDIQPARNAGKSPKEEDQDQDQEESYLLPATVYHQLNAATSAGGDPQPILSRATGSMSPSTYGVTTPREQSATAAMR